MNGSPCGVRPGSVLRRLHLPPHHHPTFTFWAVGHVKPLEASDHRPVADQPQRADFRVTGATPRDRSPTRCRATAGTRAPAFGTSRREPGALVRPVASRSSIKSNRGPTEDSETTEQATTGPQLRSVFQSLCIQGVNPRLKTAHCLPTTALSFYHRPPCRRRVLALRRIDLRDEEAAGSPGVEDATVGDDGIEAASGINRLGEAK